MVNLKKWIGGTAITAVVAGAVGVFSLITHRMYREDKFRAIERYSEVSKDKMGSISNPYVLTIDGQKVQAYFDLMGMHMKTGDMSVDVYPYTEDIFGESVEIQTPSGTMTGRTARKMTADLTNKVLDEVEAVKERREKAIKSEVRSYLAK